MSHIMGLLFCPQATQVLVRIYFPLVFDLVVFILFYHYEFLSIPAICSATWEMCAPSLILRSVILGPCNILYIPSLLSQ